MNEVSVGYLKRQLGEYRQTSGQLKVDNRELRQKIGETEDRARTLQGEVGCLNAKIRVMEKTEAVEQAVHDKHHKMRTALVGVIAHRYKEKSPLHCLDFDCRASRWCDRCVLKVWEAANVAAGREA